MHCHYVTVSCITNNCRKLLSTMLLSTVLKLNWVGLKWLSRAMTGSCFRWYKEIRDPDTARLVSHYLFLSSFQVVKYSSIPEALNIQLRLSKWELWISKRIKSRRSFLGGLLELDYSDASPRTWRQRYFGNTRFAFRISSSGRWLASEISGELDKKSHNLTLGSLFSLLCIVLNSAWDIEQ
jgi:hypothetical protein